MKSTPARPETSPMRRLQITISDRVRQKSLDELHIDVPWMSNGTRNFHFSRDICFFKSKFGQPQMRLYIIIYIYICILWYLHVNLMKLALSRHKVPYFHLLTWVLHSRTSATGQKDWRKVMARCRQAVIRLGLSRNVGMF